jgi:MarR family transcriptional regulator for hemolysin
MTRRTIHRAQLETAFIGTFSALRRELRRVYDRRLAPSGLSLSHAWPVALIAEQAGMRQRELAERLDVEGPTLVRLLDQLGAMGLVVRRPDPDDQRAKTLHLTPAGEALAGRTSRLLERIRSDLLADVADDDLASCLRVFDTLRAVLVREDADTLASAAAHD